MLLSEYADDGQRIALIPQEYSCSSAISVPQTTPGRMRERQRLIQSTKHNVCEPDQRAMCGQGTHFASHTETHSFPSLKINAVDVDAACLLAIQIVRPLADR